MLLPAVSVRADGSQAPMPDLRIVELNVTGDEFVVLQNVGDAPAYLSDYWLGYTSDNLGIAAPSERLAVAGSNKLVLPGQSLALTNSPQPACGAALVADLPFSSFANSTGQLALWQLDSFSASPTFNFAAKVSWGKAIISADDVVYEPDLPIAAEKDVATYEADQTPPVSQAVTAWYFTGLANESPAWHVGYLQGCNFTAVTDLGSNTPPPTQTIDWQTDPGGPPYIVVSAVVLGKAGLSAMPTIPAADKGLKALQLSELLPNTASPQTDANDEFIELYNPNDKTFDLSGFMLQTASATSSTTHTYHFPAGTFIAPHSFKAFKSAKTHLALNNSGGQVWFVDPLGTTVAKSEPYGKADDGLSWVNAGGKWQWTAQPTPGAENKLATPIAASGSAKLATVNGKKVTAVATGTGTVAGASTTDGAETAPTATVHPLTLAVVIAAALLYGAYEYRYDLANHYRQFRRNRSLRR